MTENLRKRIDEVRQELLACGTGGKPGKKYGDIVKNLTVKWDVSESTVERAIERARKEMQAENEQEDYIRSKIRQKYVAEIEEQHVKDERAIDALLTDIITGSARTKKIYYNKGELEERAVEPDFHARLRAAELYMKRQAARDLEFEKETEKETERQKNNGGKVVTRFGSEERELVLLEEELGGEFISGDECIVESGERLPAGQAGIVPEGREELPLVEAVKTESVQIPSGQGNKEIRNRQGMTRMESALLARKLDKYRDYANMTDDEVSWMVTDINGYWPNLPVAESEQEIDERELRIARWMKETPEGRNRKYKREWATQGLKK